ncbi:MAG: hypothetical protein KME46_21595 [Brasilonema angustatum HA4187-MV1]|nr:hypothetical protein [Brasilonema angustatum HA4187-MV1]
MLTKELLLEKGDRHAWRLQRSITSTSSLAVVQTRNCCRRSLNTRKLASGRVTASVPVG